MTSATKNIELLTEQMAALDTQLGEVKEMRATLEVSEEKRAQLEGSIDTLTEKIGAVEKALEHNKGFFAPGAPEFDKESGKGFSLARAARAHALGDWSNAQEELDILNQCKLFSHQKDQGIQVDSTGGFAVPENLAPDMIELLQTNTVFTGANLGIMEIPGVPGTMKFNRIATGFTPEAVGSEGDTITNSTMTLEQIEFMPKTVAAYAKVSNLMLASNPAGAEVWIRNQIAKDMAIKCDQFFLRGQGASGEQRGILNDPDIGTETVTDPLVKYEELEAMRLAVANANGIMGNRMAWVGSPTMLSKARLSPTSVSGLDMVRIARSEGVDAPMIGYPVHESNNFSASTGADALIFGAWDMAAIINFSGLVIARSDHKHFQEDQAAIRAVKYIDGGLLQPGAFCKSA